MIQYNTLQNIKQQQITDTNTIITEYTTNTNNTLSGINTEITNLKNITGTDGTEITNLKKITVSLSDDVANINTNISQHTTKINNLENGISQKADISALSSMEAKINDNIDVKIENVISVTNTIETNIENLNGEIVNVNNEITNQITINNNVDTIINGIKSNVASIWSEIGKKPGGSTIWENINYLIDRIACNDGNGLVANEIKIRTTELYDWFKFHPAFSESIYISRYIISNSTIWTRRNKNV